MFAVRDAEHLELQHRNHVVSDSRALQREAARGTMHRVRSGAYVAAAVWSELTAVQRRRLEVAATAEMNRDYIASHRSTGVLWGIPTIRAHDGLVHGRVTAAAGSRTEHGIRKHAVQDLALHTTTAFGIASTTLARTVLDLAATEPFDEAVVAADWALGRHLTREHLLETLDEWEPVRGRRRIEAVVRFADGRSGSPGESLSRVQIDAGGLPVPILQHLFTDADGFVGYVDFWWPACNRIGEFDGLKKYREAEFRAGRDAGQVVADEKVREDRLRATSTTPGMSRWIWDTLMRPGALVRQLTAAGMEPVRR